MLATVRWSAISDDPSDPRWGWERALYAYLAPGTREILYIGKADYCTVRERWRRSGKAGFWDALERDRGIHQHAVLVGHVGLEPGRSLSVALLGDIESLLIQQVQPWGNIQSVRSRVARPSLEVRCAGAWPLRTAVFRDS